ncbi:RNA-binding cell elongation regulator Jag/EloR [Phocicoccus pinnipedialis]|uniref:RNA-binding protein KhpB n=1 Tax=Phocicoccus pinnipedialis TaxID=110845 RepID=A0A6V7R4N7_9BACL|nr:RNA-binding cell elongation regulator Jag/EloR [Jeotgalicoccus pinnipedialis]MBP1939719.1 spoIIIJ-associated protein [Jeotgalicoccus pinnipedialis]CAD2072341.1 R3H domain protein [Jeotgalicoccus pinnipedialis]
MYKVYHAETVEEAIQVGLKDLNVEENDIKIDVVDPGKRGIFGLGKKDAEVKLTVINPELKMYESLDALKFRHTRLDNEANITDEDTVVESNVIEEEFTEEEARDEVDAITKEAIEVPNEIIEDHSQVEDEEFLEGLEDEEITETVNFSEEKSEETEDVVKVPKITFEEAAERTMNYVHSVLTEMSIKNSVTYTIDDREINIEIESDYASKIIGKRGATLNAIQEVAQSYFNRIYTSYGRIIVDTENYRMKREETLETLAMNMTKKALQTGLPVHLEPMPANERKVIHNALSNVTNIKTHSEGEEPNRYLVIQKK